MMNRIKIRWLKPMTTVTYAMIPLMAASVWFFGWRSLFLLIIVNIFGFFSEYFFLKYYKEPVSSSVFVTNILFALTLPPTIPYWMAAVGIVFGVIFGKMVFGGFGRNVFNPAIVGRAFLYISFGLHMTGRWAEPAGGILGGLVRYSTDAVSGATPVQQMMAGGKVPYLNMLLGNISGCIGETSAILVILGGLYILWKKVANYRIVVSGIGSMLLLQYILWAMGVANAIEPVAALISGGFLLGIFFMATDPVSASQTDEGRWIYGALIGVLTVLIRTFSSWPEGIMFAILLGNTVAPLMDYLIKEQKKRAKARGKA